MVAVPSCFHSLTDSPVSKSYTSSSAPPTLLGHERDSETVRPSSGGKRPSSCVVQDSSVVELSRLCHAVVAPGFEEKLLIRLSDVHIPFFHGADLRCKAYVGPAAFTTGGPDGGLDKARFRETRLDLRTGVAQVELHVGVPEPQEPWALRLKFYHRPAHHLFQQEKVAELVEAIPRCRENVELVSGHGEQPHGTARLEVVRLVPKDAIPKLTDSFGDVLLRAVQAGVEAGEVADLCSGATELGREALQTPLAAQALCAAAGAGRQAAVSELLKAGVSPNADACRAAEQANFLGIAYCILSRMQSYDQPASLLLRAMDNRLPRLADYILNKSPASLNELPKAGGASARKAHASGAWSVLAAMLARGDPMPAEPRLLLDYALRAGHAGLARACLLRCEDLGDMEGALKTCLDNGRVEIVREALEAQWRIRASHWKTDEGPALLKLECGPADEPAECGVCFDPLYKDPGVLLNEHGFRVCSHFICTECAEHVQDEAANRLRAWTFRRDSRIPKPPGPACPLCRAQYTAVKKLPDATVDPREFFRLSCVPKDADGADPSSLRLTEKDALGALCALLPVSTQSFAAELKTHLWPSWTAHPPLANKDEAGEPEEGEQSEEAHPGGHLGDEEGVLAEDDFLRPGGMLAWLSDHLLELKVEQMRGSPPSLQRDPRAWFRHFDYDGQGRLLKAELLRGIAKAYDVAVLASPRTPARRARTVGVQKLRDLVEALWDDERWSEGVPVADFEGPGGLAERVLAALPGEAPAPTSPTQARMSVEEALERARKEDFEHREESEARAKERAEARKRVAAQMASAMPAPRTTALPHAGGGGGGAGADTFGRAAGDVVVATILEQAAHARSAAVGHGSRRVDIHVQCPFCSAINACRVAPGHNVVCGGCRSVFRVPRGN